MKLVRFSIVYFLVFAVLIGLLRLFLIHSEPWTLGANSWAKTRIRGSLNALAHPILRKRNVVLFLGASEAEVGFDPIAFDQLNREAGKHSLSLNLAVHNIGTFLPLYFERIAYELENRDLRPKAIFVHFPISRLTRAARNNFAEMQKTHDMPSVYFTAGLWAGPFAFQDKIEMAINKWLFAEHSLLQIPLLFGRSLKHWTNQVNKRPDQQFFSLITTAPESAWNARGRFYNIPPGALLKNTPIPSATISSEDFLEMIQQNDACCDFKELHLDPEYTRLVLTSFKKIALLAEHVVIVDLRENPLFARSAESLSRKNSFLRQLAESTGAEIWPFDYKSDEFVDVLHLSPRGTKTFSEDLSLRIPAEWL